MPWKKDAEGNIVVENGNPMLVHSDGKEVAIDGDQMVSKIAELNTESAGRRRQLRELQEKMKPFETVEDPEDFMDRASSAINTVKNLSDKKLIDAGEVEKVKSEVAKAAQEKIDAAEKRAADAEDLLNQSVIGGSFEGSKYLKDRLAIPVDMVREKFARHFSVKDGKPVATDQNGIELYSREKPGELAGFDEAIEMLIDQYPFKDSILKSDTPPGSDLKKPSGDSKPGQITSDLNPTERLKAARRAGAKR